MNRYLVDGWVPAPKRRRRITGTYFHFQVDAPTEERARVVVEQAYPKIKLLRVEREIMAGERLKVLGSWSTED